MSTHNLGFHEEISKIIFQLSSNAHLVCPSECLHLLLLLTESLTDFLFNGSFEKKVRGSAGKIVSITT